jgi:hypothetical protein
MTTTSRKEPTALDELVEIRRTLQDAGLTLLQAASAAVSAAAKDTLAATTAVIEAADDTLQAAEEKVRKLRADLRRPR